MPRRVLIVEDDDVIRARVRSYVPSGWEILEAADATTALQMYQQWLPALDLIVLDMHLPQNESCEVLARVHELDPRILVLSVEQFVKHWRLFKSDRLRKYCVEVSGVGI